MCGILGAIDVPIESALLDTLRHRGPDGDGLDHLWLGDRWVTLGHRRLAIVDPSFAGHQPMTCGDLNEWLVFNGEIYNHCELRGELPGIQWRGHSDTETLLHLMRAHGTAALKQLNGVFAFGLLDARARKLYLVRDPFGVKPLYYWRCGERFVFSSELRPIQQIAGAALDRASLAEFLRLGYCPAPDTLLRDIYQVRPGHVVEVDLGGDALALREFSFQDPVPPPAGLGYREALERYRELLDAAVRRQLMADVEIGVLLSGGVDSALVARLAREHSPGRLPSFTVGFTEGADADEIPAARRSAELLGLDHHEVRIGFEQFLDTLTRSVRSVEAPLASSSLVPMDYLCRLAAGSVKVVLSGQGADEPLGGYGHYQGELWRERVPGFVFRASNPLAAHLPIRNEQILRGLDSLGTRDDVERSLRVYTVFGEAQIRALIGAGENRAAERIRYFYDLLQCRRQRRAVERMMSLDLRLSLADNLLQYTDRVSMRHSLECRVPMLDLPLVRFLESLPARYRVRLGRTKVIHKDLARRLLPAEIVRRKKNGFLAPTRMWFRGSREVRDILLAPNTPFGGVFDLKAVERILAEHERGFHREKQIFLLLGFQSWLC